MDPRSKAGVAILISNKIDFKPKLIKRYREEHFILIKGKIYQDYVSILKSIPQMQWGDIPVLEFNISNSQMF